jgi:dGTPase
MFSSLSNRFQQANSLLAPYAVMHGEGLGRVHAEEQDETRFPFQRDRDRIIHTQAFRRLQHKTQVFAAGTGDHYRTRMTHTLEVAQISRDIARTLSLNEDLAESVALAHDLGHTPFGHAGEEAMRSCVEPYGKSFEHNEQSLRIVTVLEDRSSQFPGLNLMREVHEGMMKHRTPHDYADGSAIPRAPTLEAQVVNLADEIAYTAHDTDDGLRAGVFTLGELSALRLPAAALSRAERRGTDIRGSLVTVLVTDLYQTSQALLEGQKILSLADVYHCKSPLIDFSAAMQEDLKELRAFLWKRFYLSEKVTSQAQHGRETIAALFEAYMQSPPPKVISLQQKTGGALEEAVKDYIAGMTDIFALGARAEL